MNKYTSQETNMYTIIQLLYIVYIFYNLNYFLNFIIYIYIYLFRNDNCLNLHLCFRNVNFAYYI